MTAYACFKCGQAGHFAADCRWESELGSSLPGPPSQPPAPRPSLRRDPDPPTPAYLQERQRLGMPASGPAVLSAACPWCRAPQWRRCVNVATGAETDPHYERQDAAGVAQPSVRLAHLALRQVAESRAARSA